MGYYAGLDVSLKRTALCVVDDEGAAVWEGWADTHPEMIFRALERWTAELAKVGIETDSLTPWLARALKEFGLPVVVMDARRPAAAVKARPSKTDRADARTLHSQSAPANAGTKHLGSVGRIEDGCRNREGNGGLVVLALAEHSVLWCVQEVRPIMFMCELFGMGSRLPDTVNLPMDKFAHHGGLTGLPRRRLGDRPSRRRGRPPAQGVGAG